MPGQHDDLDGLEGHCAGILRENASGAAPPAIRNAGRDDAPDLST
jgi:hypothetical protein